MPDNGVPVNPRPAYSPAIAAWAESIVDELSRNYQFGYSAVMLYEPEADGLLLAGERSATGTASEPGVGALIVPLASVSGAVFRSGTPALLADVRAHPDYRPVSGVTPGSELAVPILVDGKAVGTINVESPRIGGLGIADLERLQAVARRAAETFPDS
jgi:GAF domain-containing protein